MDLLQIRDQLQNLVSDLSGLPTRWSGVASDGIWGDSWAQLDLISIARRGEDEVRIMRDVVDEPQNTLILGHRRVVVQMKIDSPGISFSESILWRTLALLECPTSYESLASVGVNIFRVGPSRSLDYCDCDGIRRSASVVEIDLDTIALVECAPIEWATGARVLGDVLYPDTDEIALTVDERITL